MALPIDPQIGQAAAATVAGAPAPKTPLVDPAKAAALAAGAHGGQAGIDAYKQAQAQLDTLQANALKNAQARAALIGGPESQGFEALANQAYDRSRANLLTQQNAFTGQQAANKAAFEKYFGQLHADLPKLNEYIKSQLSSYEAKKKANAPFPLAEIKGLTEAGLPQAKTESEAATQAATAAAGREAQLKGGEFSAPTKERLQGQVKAMHDYDDRMRRKYGKEWDKLAFGDPGAQEALLAHGGGDATLKDIAGRAVITDEISRLRGLYNRASGNEARQLPAATAKVAETQQAAQEKALLATPEGYARNVAVTRFGVSPEKATGKLTPDVFVPKQSKYLDTQKYGAEAVGLADKLNITGGPENVARLMQSKEYTETVAEARKLAVSGKTSLNEVKHHIQEQYGEKYPNLTKIIIEQISGFGWKREK